MRALQATGVIESFDTSNPNVVVVTFDLDKPASKYMAGPVITIPDVFPGGADLTLNPLPILDPAFAAHANCKNLNP